MVFRRDYCPICYSKMHWFTIVLFGGLKYRGVCSRCGYTEEHETSALDNMFVRK